MPDAAAPRQSGGARPGAGRKPVAQGGTVGVTLRLTLAQRETLRRLGGAAWLRALLDERGKG